MSDPVFTRGKTPFADRDVLSDRYTPDKLVGRDTELQQYTDYLEPAIWGEDPNNIFLYGKTGVGKTAATRYLLSHLQQDVEQYPDTEIESVYINCDGLTTSYRVAIDIINSLREPPNKIGESGYSTSEVYDMMWDELESIGSENDSGKTVIVLLVLDEIDHTEVGEDSILYQLSRAAEQNTLNSTRVGVIGISNDLTFSDRLSPKVKSSLCQKKIFFETYEADELRKVLQQRATIAFKEDALDSGVIPLCAAYGRKQSGDAREALDLLRAAGDIARNDNRAVVTEEHVTEGQSRVQREGIIAGVRSLHDHSRYVLYALATLSAENQTPARTRTIHERYINICDIAGVEALTSRRVRDFLRELDMLGALTISERNQGEAGGHYYEFELDHALETIVTALEGTINEVGIHESVSATMESE